MQRAGSQLRRQYSQQDPIPRRLSQSDSGVDISTAPSQVRLPMPRMHSQGGQQQGPYGQYTQHPGLPQPPMQQSPYGHPQSHMNPQVQITRPSGNVGMGGYAQEDPSYYQVTRKCFCSAYHSYYNHRNHVSFIIRVKLKI